MIIYEDPERPFCLGSAVLRFTLPCKVQIRKFNFKLKLRCIWAEHIYFVCLFILTDTLSAASQYKTFAD